jgi:glucosamine--fructose-6-phosphate aminotransferase (isomerizing)
VTLAFSYEDPGFGPGTISYIASLGALYALAWRAKELAEGQSRRGCPWDTAGVADATAETIELSAVLAEQLAARLPDDAKIDILGGGPSLGTALFGRAKLIESAHSPGGAHELEEWAHEEFFCTRPGVTTIVVTPPGASHDRAVEQLEAARKVGATTVAVSPSPVPADLALPVAAGTPEELSPLTYCVPLELLAYHYASSRGLTMLGFDDESRRSLNYHQIFGE